MAVWAVMAVGLTRVSKRSVRQLIKCAIMESKPVTSRRSVDVDVAALEADVAYFDARLSLAAKLPETAYQKAQIRTYETLGQLISGTLENLRARNKDGC